jgi:queuine tRNA-ribosyltransferase subunit QTRTD1
MSIMTAFGFTKLQATQFRSMTTAMAPDILVGLGDIPYGYYKVSHKKIDKITDRTAKWMQAHVDERTAESIEEKEQGTKMPLLYAPLLPLPVEAQKYYMDCLVNDMLQDIQGLVIYDTITMQQLPPQLQHLARLGLNEPNNPRAVLDDIYQGIDISTLPFLSTVTDAGIALDFSFPVVSTPTLQTPTPLGTNMWQTKYATDTSPLGQNCPCYACSNHHCAFLHHLLSAKEMLAWVLLQIHNHHVIDEFFAGIRQSIQRGTFEQDIRDFERVYEPEFPESEGRGPR